jgi:hypothetical protein
MIDVKVIIGGSINLSGLDNAETRIIDPIVGKWTEKTRGALASKPPPPELPNQKYQRTGRISGWETKRLAPGAYEFANTARVNGRWYGIYVLGNAEGDRRDARKHNRQAWMHKGRWYLAYDIIEEATNELPGEIAKGFADNF